MAEQARIKDEERRAASDARQRTKSVKKAEKVAAAAAPQVWVARLKKSS